MLTPRSRPLNCHRFVNHRCCFSAPSSNSARIQIQISPSLPQPCCREALRGRRKYGILFARLHTSSRALKFELTDAVPPAGHQSSSEMCRRSFNCSKMYAESSPPYSRRLYNLYQSSSHGHGATRHLQAHQVRWKVHGHAYSR